MENKVLTFTDKVTGYKLVIIIRKWNDHRYLLTANVPGTSYSEQKAYVPVRGWFLKIRLNHKIKKIRKHYERIKEYLIEDQHWGDHGRTN